MPTGFAHYQLYNKSVPVLLHSGHSTITPNSTNITFPFYEHYGRLDRCKIYTREGKEFARTHFVAIEDTIDISISVILDNSVFKDMVRVFKNNVNICSTLYHILKGL